MMKYRFLHDFACIIYGHFFNVVEDNLDNQGEDGLDYILFQLV